MSHRLNSLFELVHLQADSALGLYNELRSLDLELTESEFRLVIAALVGTQKWDDARYIFLLRLEVYAFDS